VGQSTGVHDHGKGELEDARAGLVYLSEHYPEHEITVCGFSFGSRMGMEVGGPDDRVKWLISIGTPIDKYDYSFIESIRKPLLLVHGENDEFGNINELRKLVSKWEQSVPLKLVVIPGADHFFQDQLDQLKNTITEWMSEQLTR
jgi:alpha/beta superfamily hydrolase